MNNKTKQEIEEDAKLAVQAMQLEDACPYPQGTAAHAVWLDTYKRESKLFHDAIDEEYAFIQELERGYSKYRI